MAQPIDELIIQIKADTKQLQKELDQIKGKARVAGATGGAAFAGMSAVLTKLKGPLIAVGAGIAAIGALSIPIARVGMQFEDLKDSLDTVFGSIEQGDVAMSRILNFAQKTPFQIETVTKAFISLKSAGIEPSNRMLQVFADTASTSVDQLGVFEALVRTVQRSASGGLGLEELNMIMDRGIDVLGILNDELGLTKNEIADFGATAQGAKLITDALVNGLERKFGGAMESKMDNLSTKASNMTIAFKELGNQLFESGLADMLKSVADSLTELASGLAATIAASRGVGLGVVLGDDPHENLVILDEQREKLIKQKEEQQKLVDSVAEGTVKYERYNKNLQDTKDVLANVEKEARRIDQALLKKQKTFQGLNQTQTETIRRQGELKRGFDFVSQVSEKLIGDTITAEKVLGDLSEIIEKNKEAFDKLGVSEEQVKTALQDIIDESNALAQTFDEELQQAVVNQSNAFTTDFVNSLMEGESALDSFKNFAQNMVSQIISIFLQMGVVNEILNNVFNLQGDNKLATLDGNAGGGRVQAGRPTLVGERGAELFIPDSSGVIMNNMNTKGALGGGTPVIVNQSLNFATGVVPTVRAEVTKMLPQIADVTKGAVLESAMRGGAYARGLRRG